MLTNPMMGVLALAIVWVNALLIAAAAWKELGPIGAVRRAAARGTFHGEVVRGLGPDGAFAVHRIEQVGRATDAGEIVFSDRNHTSEIFGGVVRLEDGREVEVAAAAVAKASPLDLEDGVIEVWPDDAVHQAASACPSAAAFAAALELGRKARGYPRTVEAAIGPGANIWWVGEETPRLVAMVDPRSWASKKTRLVVGFVVAELAAAGLATAIALVPPAFGLVSKLGGALCLGYFLGVQPIGTAIRDAVRSPARRALRGRWSRDPAADSARIEATS